jgi:hypothetical protein
VLPCLASRTMWSRWKPNAGSISRTCPPSASGWARKSASSTAPSAKLQGHPQDPHGRTADVGDEAADVLILLMSIANRCGINLEDAFRAKESRNESRTWQ